MRSLAGDNKHGIVAVLTVLCFGHYVYWYKDIDSGLHKRKAIERSTIKKKIITIISV